MVISTLGACARTETTPGVEANSRPNERTMAAGNRYRLQACELKQSWIPFQRSIQAAIDSIAYHAAQVIVCSSLFGSPGTRRGATVVS